MLLAITFTIPGKPGAKQRHRSTSKGHMYTPGDTINYENYIKYIYYNLKQRYWFTCAVKIGFRAYLKVPKSESKVRTQKMLDGEIRHTKKPDIDNMLKIIMDGLNGVAYPDDKQVCGLLPCEKVYTLGAEQVEVTIKAMSMKGVEKING